MFYPPDFSYDITVFVLQNVMADQFDDMRECAHCQLRLTLHSTWNTPNCILLRVAVICT
jgi:hypothetical protein